ncbi:hypothetical protein EDF46_0081 [Frondihabitans sp. PhB188]|uniref:PepSY domain-containing protein n=1 Tax=Frondihabitans sp. PhB188 TaxID=2485200 RepID=UPI000F9214AF|nr:PepSY domain-containing protein [Frondihabitans sp. PhB188]ROQ40721.1 hypothetical protein EDF46_0081 [Frondihabitans sp. PhB188]
MFTTKKPQTIALAVALPLVGALALAGCSTSTADQGAGSGSSPTTAASAPATTSSPAPGATSSASDAGALTTAAKTALAAVSGGSILSIEQEAGATSWEILVATSDGAEQEVHTGADGTSITAGPAKKPTDAEDLAENKAFVAASGIGYAKAASTMTATVAGTVVELGLDDHLGKTVWEGDVVDAAGAKHSIRLDSSTGAVVTNTVDSDD